MTRKAHDDEEHKQFLAFADKVAHLSDDDWRRLSASCADFNSTTVVVRAAGDALMNRRFIEASSFDAIYAFIEPVISFASLTSQP